MKKKKIIIYALSFFIPLFIISIFTLIMQISIFDSQLNIVDSFLTADMGGQYVSLYDYFHDVLIGNGSFFYSFSKGLGGNMASTIGYYLSSPFNLLYVFISKSNISMMIWITYMLKISLCSLFMCVFLSHKYGSKYMNIIFSLCYAFMGFTTVYYFNNMWLDVIYMTPLVISGVDRLFEGKQNMYIITLGLSIIFNFYMAFMLCIFCLIYFVYKLLKKHKIKEFKEYKKILLQFVISSLIAAGLSAILLIPSTINLKEFMRSPLDVGLLDFDIIESLNNIISKTYIGAHGATEILGRNRPVIYVNLFCLILSIFYFFNNKIQKREKLLSFFVLLVFILSFSVPILKLIWQGFSFPNGYIDRFSFLYCFFIIYLASKTFYVSAKPKLQTCIMFISIYILISIYLITLKLSYLDNFRILISVIFVVISIILYIMYQNTNHKAYIVCICVLIIFELGYNLNTSISLLADSFHYSKYVTQVCDQINNLDEKFYRVEGDYKYNQLNEFICNNAGIETALSTSDKSIYNFLYNNGITVSYISVYYDVNELPILDSMLGVKYIYSENELNDHFYDYHTNFYSEKYDIFNESFDSQRINLYENQYALSLGYIVDENSLELSYKNTNNSFENLNNFIKTLSGISDDVLIPLEKEITKDDKYKFSGNQEENLYLSYDYDLSLYYNVHGQIYINEEYYDDIRGDNLGTIKIESEYIDDEILIEINDETDTINDVNLYYFDLDAFEKAIDILKQNQLENVFVKGNKVSGNIEVDEDGVLFLSIPYEKGWNIYVDGEKVSYKKIADTFIGINLSKGEHKIEMKFYSPGLFVGGLVSLFSLISLILLNLFKQKNTLN